MKNLTRSLSYVAIFFVLLSGTSCSSDNTKAAEASNEPPVSVTAVKLLADYEADEKAADKTYKGKNLIVSGEMLSREAKQDGTATVLINSDESSIGSIQCLFTTEQAASTSTLQQGQQVSIKGVCGGMDDIKVSVLLKNSTIQ